MSLYKILQYFTIKSWLQIAYKNDYLLFFAFDENVNAQQFFLLFLIVHICNTDKGGESKSGDRHMVGFDLLMRSLEHQP